MSLFGPLPLPVVQIDGLRIYIPWYRHLWCFVGWHQWIYDHSGEALMEYGDSVRECVLCSKFQQRFEDGEIEWWEGQ